ncbi:hypothetical protein ES705_29683 [subsurface metagenome]
MLVTEDKTLRSFKREEIQLDEYGKYKIPLMGNGGFVIMFGE